MKLKTLSLLTATVAVCVFTIISCKKNDGKSTTNGDLDVTQQIQAVNVTDTFVYIPITSSKFELINGTHDSVLTGSGYAAATTTASSNAKTLANNDIYLINLGLVTYGATNSVYNLQAKYNAPPYTAANWYLLKNGVRSVYLGSTLSPVTTLNFTATLDCGSYYEIVIDEHDNGSTVITGSRTSSDTVHGFNYIEATGVGDNSQGADVCIANINGTGTKDLLFVAQDNPSGTNTYRYYVKFDVDQNGNSSNVSAVKYVPAGLDDVDGSGATIADVDGDGYNDLILVSYDDPSGVNYFVYTIGWHLKTNGEATSWSTPVRVEGLSDYGKGCDVAIADIDKDGNKDIVLMAADAPTSGVGNLRYKIGWNVKNGVATSWSSSTISLRDNLQGDFGLEVQDVYNNGQLYFVIYAPMVPIDETLSGGTTNYPGLFYLPINSTGVLTEPNVLTDPNTLNVLRPYKMGNDLQGAGFAMGDIDNDNRNDLIMMTLDNPSGANYFRYYILYGYKNNIGERYGTESFKSTCNH